ncbi:hypothetical protein D3C87_1967260 [compost metagenome]
MSQRILRPSGAVVEPAQVEMSVGIPWIQRQAIVIGMLCADTVSEVFKRQRLIEEQGGAMGKPNARFCQDTQSLTAVSVVTEQSA